LPTVSRTKHVALDTSILLEGIQTKIDIFHETKKALGKTAWVIPNSMIEELENQENKSKIRANQVKLVKKMLKQHNVKKKETQKKGDAALTELAEKGYIIATQDKDLQKELKEKKRAFIYFNKSKQLQMYLLET
jgi:rRNA-processing protein FCF1